MERTRLENLMAVNDPRSEEEKILAADLFTTAMSQRPEPIESSEDVFCCHCVLPLCCFCCSCSFSRTVKRDKGLPPTPGETLHVQLFLCVVVRYSLSVAVKTVYPLREGCFRRRNVAGDTAEAEFKTASNWSTWPFWPAFRFDLRSVLAISFAMTSCQVLRPSPLRLVCVSGFCDQTKERTYHVSGK